MLKLKGLDEDGIVSGIRGFLGKGVKGDRYMGTDKEFRGTRKPVLRHVAKELVAAIRDWPLRRKERLLLSLCGKGHEEFIIAATAVQYDRGLRLGMSNGTIRKMLEISEGWGEVDALCQQGFGAREFRERKGWKEFIRRLAREKKAEMRRASLVLLVRPAREMDISDFALSVAEMHKSSGEVLVSKALSWLLREMARDGREERIRKWVEERKDVLRPFVVREVIRKLETGRKTGKKG